MESNAKGKGFKMKGHTLPGINQRSEGNTDLPDGRSASSAFQYKSPNKFDMASMGSMTGGEGGGGNGGGLTDALGSLTGGGKSDKKGGEQKREVPRPYFY